MTPFERLLGDVPMPPVMADYRDNADAVGEAVYKAANKDRDRFFTIVEEEPTLLERHDVLGVLGGFDDERAIPLLTSALRSKESTTRWSAAHALAEKRGKPVVDAFIAALRDRAPTVRAIAIEALGKLRDRRALDPLRDAMTRPSNHKDDYLRKLLEQAIGRLHR